MGTVFSGEPEKVSVMFSRLMYPKVLPPEYKGFMIVLYRVYDPNRRQLPKSVGGEGFTTITAVGENLPILPKVNFILLGHWENGKRGPQFKVSSHSMPTLDTEEGVIGYLTCGCFRGMTPSIARRIYRVYGKDTLKVCDEEIDKLAKIPRFSSKNFEKFKESYILQTGCKRLLKLLSPFKVSGKQVQKFYKAYGDEDIAINTVEQNPYKLCEISGVSFRVADEIAKKYKLDPKMPERIREAALYALREQEMLGNTCCSGKVMCESVCKICDFPVTKDIRNVVLPPIKLLIDRGVIVKYNDMFSRKETGEIEDVLAGRICRALKHRPNRLITNLDAEIDTIQKKLGLTFAERQVQAVQMALDNNIAFSVITGGPGCGKTLIQKAILEIFTKQHPTAPILCCSPTGKAARRMTESTGYPAQTVHSALGLCVSENGEFNTPQTIDAELIVVDECSMLDTFVAASLFDAIRNGCRVVFVGDQDQLPSVGAGCVLADLLNSEQVPFVMLNAVFRQAKGSPIATNAQAINKGETKLVFDEEFQFIPCNDINKSVEILIQQYVDVAKEFGPDAVALLSPFRRSTETGVNALNKRLQEIINPAADNKNEIACNGLVFREGDRVMQIKNYGKIANGDVGKIEEICERDEDGVKELVITIDFSDVTVEYSKEELKMLDLAYCTTVHKSQGSEYHTIILTLQQVHSLMLTRPLIYTAITRGKKRVIIVGEESAVKKAILTNDTQKRLTCLKERIQARFEPV